MQDQRLNRNIVMRIVSSRKGVASLLGAVISIAAIILGVFTWSNGDKEAGTWLVERGVFALVACILGFVAFTAIEDVGTARAKANAEAQTFLSDTMHVTAEPLIDFDVNTFLGEVVEQLGDTLIEKLKDITPDWLEPLLPALQSVAEDALKDAADLTEDDATEPA